MPFNTIINWSNVTSFTEVPAQANVSTGDLFWVVTLYMLWVVLLLLLINWGFEISFLVASFLAMIMGLLLAYADLVGWSHVIFFVSVILIFFMLVSWQGKKRT